MSDAHALTLALRGKWYGGYGLAFCPAHANTRTPALRLANGFTGCLLAKCSAGCDFIDVLGAIVDLGLIDHTGRVRTLGPSETAQVRAQERSDAERRVRLARDLWRDGQPIDGTLADRYLRARSIRAPLPPTLRFQPDAWHATAQRLPAMLAAVIREGEPHPIAVHRTYLAEPGQKAEISPDKAMIGVVKGAAVRLSTGPGPLVVAEGIETALSVLDRLASSGPNVWAALSASGIAALRLPDPPGALTIVPDGDRAGLEAAEKLAERAHWRGWEVRFITPPADGLDWNDIARRECAI